MPIVDRRRVLLGLGASLVAGCTTEALRGRPGQGRNNRDEGGATGDSDPPDSGLADTGSADTGSADTGDPGPTLAETGPSLADRVPTSLTTGDDAELDLTLAVISGTLPTDLQGVVYIVHAVPRGDSECLFTGDGRMLRLDLEGGSVQLTSRLSRTPCYYADQATQGHDAGFSTTALARTSMTLGSRNMANTGWLALGDRLLVTYDGGRPWEVDPATLALVTAVGAHDEWRFALPEWIGWFIDWPFKLTMSTAHPAADPTSGTLFTVDYGFGMLGTPGFLRVLSWDGAGALNGWQIVDEWGLPREIQQSVHQIAVTRDHVVIMDTAFNIEMESLWDEAAIEAQSPDTVVTVVRRSDLRAGGTTAYGRQVVLPREAAHFLADYDDSGGRITLYLSHNCAADPSEMLREGDLRADTGQPVRSDLHGMISAPTDLGALGRYVIDTSSGAVLEEDVLFDELLTWGGPALYTYAGTAPPDRFEHIWWCNVGFHPELRLQRTEDLYADYPYRQVSLAALPTTPVPATLFRVDAATHTVADHYVFPAGRVALSPTHVPSADSSDELDGYIVCTVISDDTSEASSTGDEIWIFAAGDLAQGPLVRLGHAALDLPFTLHTQWMPAAVPRSASYQVDVRADHEGPVSKLAADLQQVFEDHVYPHFES